ncbi:MAG: hypothetical protein PHH54_01565 [Candidatus Nanoarchaeia archaeon]|nr:hypothetical protein [Candidatus Nanoarchaeia archaeon]MDD5740652.1 hypothetical protein [Candidatus Nanoarchaeia archaeon]
MTNLYNIIQKTAENEINSGSHKGNLILEEFYEKPHFEGKTKLNTGDIEIRYNPEYENRNPGKTSIVAKDITFHEIDHAKYKNCIGCPQTLNNHVKLFYEPMADVLLKKGFSQSDVHYCANALQDTILHYDGSANGRRSLEGIALFFKDVGENSKDEKGKIKFTGFYEAHVKLNMHLWGNKQQKKSMKKFYTHKDEINKAMKNFLKKTKGKNFLNESDWKSIAELYAEEFSRLMEPGYAMPLLNHSGKGTKGKESGKQGGLEQEVDSEQDSDEGNVFDRQMRTKEYKKSRIRESYSNDEKAPSWIDNFEAMDLLYESLAQKLNIKSKTFTQDSKMPICYYGKRDFDPKKDNLKNLGFGYAENGELGLKKKRWHQDLPISVKKRPLSFPRMRFGLLDTSDSMREDVNGGDSVGSTKIFPWGDKSKYHYALLSWYGFLEYLKQNHLMNQTNIDLGNFSSRTLVGKGLKQAKEIALAPQFGTTKIELDKINHFFEGRDSLIFTLSDGGISNWDSIKDDFIKNAKKHQYFHLQIGHSNGTTEDLEQAGLYVDYIRNAEDLAGKTIDLTDKLFRR